MPTVNDVGEAACGRESPTRFDGRECRLGDGAIGYLKRETVRREPRPPRLAKSWGQGRSTKYLDSPAAPVPDPGRRFLSRPGRAEFALVALSDVQVPSSARLESSMRRSSGSLVPLAASSRPTSVASTRSSGATRVRGCRNKQASRACRAGSRIAWAVRGTGDDDGRPRSGRPGRAERSPDGPPGPVRSAGRRPS